jgi:hypothetical protein
MASVPGRDTDHKGEVVIMARLVTTVETVGSARAGGAGGDGGDGARGLDGSVDRLTLNSKMLVF